MAYTYPTAVREFLAAYRYKIEMHAHTSPVSGCSEIPPEKLIALMVQQGYDAVVITNHFAHDNWFQNTEDPVGTYLADYRAAREAGEKAGITVLLGAEYRFAENSNDYLVYGVDEAFLRETADQLRLPFTQFYETYHAPERLILQAHPFRNGIVCAPPDHLDGIEAFNLHPHHNSRVAIAARYGREQNFPVEIIGTDLHHLGHEGVTALRAKTLPKTEQELVALLRSGDYLFEIGGRPLLPYGSFEN